MRNEGKGRSKNGPAIRPRLNSFDSLSETAAGFWVADKWFCGALHNLIKTHVETHLKDSLSI